MTKDYQIVTLTDGRRGFFYHTRFTGAYWFQPVDEDNCAMGPVEMPTEDHEYIVTEADDSPKPDYGRERRLDPHAPWSVIHQRAHDRLKETS